MIPVYPILVATFYFIRWNYWFDPGRSSYPRPVQVGCRNCRRDVAQAEGETVQGHGAGSEQDRHQGRDTAGHTDKERLRTGSHFEGTWHVLEKRTRHAHELINFARREHLYL